MSRIGLSAWRDRSHLALIMLILIAGAAVGCLEREPEAHGISGSGTLEGQTVTVASELGGQLHRVSADEGQEITAGEAIAFLSDAEARVQTLQASAGVAEAEAQLARLRAGERPEAIAAAEAKVRQAESRAQEAAQAVTYAQQAVRDPIEVDLQIAEARTAHEIARQQVEQAKAELAGAELNVHIYVTLKEEVNAETRQTYALRLRAAESKVVQAEAEARAAQAELNGLLALRANPLETRAHLHAAQSNYTATIFAVDEAVAHVNELKAGARQEELTIAKAHLAQAQAVQEMALAQQSMLTLTAPISGVVTARHYLAGEFAPAGRPIITLTRLDPLRLRLYVAEARLHEVRIGQVVTITADLYPNETFPGTVTRIANQAEYTPRSIEIEGDRARRVFAVEVEVPNPDRRLQPGIPVQAVIDTGSP